MVFCLMQCCMTNSLLWYQYDGDMRYSYISSKFNILRDFLRCLMGYSVVSEAGRYIEVSLYIQLLLDHCFKMLEVVNHAKNRMIHDSKKIWIMILGLGDVSHSVTMLSQIERIEILLLYFLYCNFPKWHIWFFLPNPCLCGFSIVPDRVCPINDYN